MRDKVKSFQIYAERFEFIPTITSRYYVLAKGRPQGILEVIYVSLYANGDDKIKNVYRVFNIRGVQARIDDGKDVDSHKLEAYTNPIYLADGHEIGLVMQGEKFDTPCQVFVQYIWHPDEDK